MPVNSLQDYVVDTNCHSPAEAQIVLLCSYHENPKSHRRNASYVAQMHKVGDTLLVERSEQETRTQLITAPIFHFLGDSSDIEVLGWEDPQLQRRTLELCRKAKDLEGENAAIFTTFSSRQVHLVNVLKKLCTTSHRVIVELGALHAMPENQRVAEDWKTLQHFLSGYRYTVLDFCKRERLSYISAGFGA